MPDGTPQGTLIRRVVDATRRPTTVDTKARTAEALAATSTPVRRSGFRPDGGFGDWIEQLDVTTIDPTAVAGVPVLLDHMPKVSEQVGVVEAARTSPEGLVTRMRFSEKPDAEAVFRDVAGGILRSVSIGYSVATWQRAGGDVDLPVFIAGGIRILEVSIVPVPADPSARFRSHDGVLSPMSETTIAPVDTDATTMTRAATAPEVQTLTEKLGLPAAWGLAQLSRGVPFDQVRDAAIDAIAAQRGPVPRHTSAFSGTDWTDPAMIRSRMASAYAARVGGGEVPAEGREFMGDDLLTLAGHLANQRGARIKLTDRGALADHLLSREHSTSDFPLLLADAANKVLQPRYQAAPVAYRAFGAERQFRDFKSQKFLRLGDFPQMQVIAEGGEVQFGTMTEKRETVTPKEYGSGFSITRRALVNDDLGAFADWALLIGQRVAADENRVTFELLATNGPTMSDSVALFNSAHGNKAASGGALDITTFTTGVKAMFEQTTLDGLKLNVGPRFIVCGSALMVSARAIVANITPTTVNDVNVFSGSAEVLVDANMGTGNRWMLFADPAVLPVVVYGWVNNQRGPQIRSEVDFATRSLKVAVGDDFAVGVIDYRGAYLNAGS